jgi:hypothetical protein
MTQVRMTIFTCQIVRPVEGSGGAQSEVIRFNRINPKFRKGMGYANKIVAGEAVKSNATPLVQLKRDVRRLLEEHKYGPLPPLASVAYKGFDWNGKYDEAEHVELDDLKRDQIEGLRKKCVRERASERAKRQPVAASLTLLAQMVERPDESKDGLDQVFRQGRRAARAWS